MAQNAKCCHHKFFAKSEKPIGTGEAAAEGGTCPVTLFDETEDICPVECLVE